MQRFILLVSQNQKLPATHMLSLEREGYRVHYTGSLPDALIIAARSAIVILGHTITAEEQIAFIDAVHETNSSIYVLCLRFELSDPQVLLRACHECFASQPGGPHVRVFEAPDMPFRTK